MDIQWKSVDASNPTQKYGLSQSDYDQLFSHNHMCRADDGEMRPLYPQTATFHKVRLPGHFPAQLERAGRAI